jgi:predicted CopG family antitoxin
MQKNYKTIVVRSETYHTLRHLGTVTESFNDVISRLIKKAASGHDSFQGLDGQKTAAPRSPKGEDG